ncbi:FkbM family methyltransferase [Pseudaestuariivita atlantica]|uniref:FkbM family methyltransferase n=1 Tax=Pseudaestuariivita atlantica TaxID=1317121 RepID=A0A0L1JKW9_9RHOB|nr:FkbM family methyltransferase [Pseudaestuariivita atlantica]KNG92395.1 FkbM family methyltransferase [Pseudaestuariivita atlantica]
MDDGQTFAPRNPFLNSRGLKIPKHPQFTTGQVRGALRENRYELRESDAAQRIIRKEDVVLELGGGIGYMSALMAKICGAKHVHTFEANPALIPYMHEVHAANGIDNITIHHALLAQRKSKPVTFYVRRNFLASSMDRDNAEDIVSEHEVEVRGLNTTLKDLQPTVLMCDIEGAEAELLPHGDFSGLRAAIIETHPQWIGQHGVQAVFDAMHRAGLTYFPKASTGKVVTFLKGW